ncbi:Uncharacterised protein [Bordetella pertussis]|nr:Uncharacterised protein [Bordetella pertussis]CFW39123.1 Uncharacterised protein [Bordetella pertussis]
MLHTQSNPMAGKAFFFLSEHCQEVCPHLPGITSGGARRRLAAPPDGRAAQHACAFLALHGQGLDRQGVFGSARKLSSRLSTVGGDNYDAARGRLGHF